MNTLVSVLDPTLARPVRKEERHDMHVEHLRVSIQHKGRPGYTLVCSCGLRKATCEDQLGQQQAIRDHYFEVIHRKLGLVFTTGPIKEVQ